MKTTRKLLCYWDAQKQKKKNAGYYYSITGKYQQAIIKQENNLYELLEMI